MGLEMRLSRLTTDAQPPNLPTTCSTPHMLVRPPGGGKDSRKGAPKLYPGPPTPCVGVCKAAVPPTPCLVPGEPRRVGSREGPGMERWPSPTQGDGPLPRRARPSRPDSSSPWAVAVQLASEWGPLPAPSLRGTGRWAVCPPGTAGCGFRRGRRAHRWLLWAPGLSPSGSPHFV